MTLRPLRMKQGMSECIHLSGGQELDFHQTCNELQVRGVELEKSLFLLPKIHRY
jgi:hypothetical protein